jgi:hypothetical protein
MVASERIQPPQEETELEALLLGGHHCCWRHLAGCKGLLLIKLGFT